MKHFFKIIIKYTIVVCVKMYYTIVWIFQIIRSTDFRNHIKKENGELVTILANGPSLKNEINNIDFSKGEFCVVNFFYKSPFFKVIKPKYYMLADPNFFKEEDYIKSLIDSIEWDVKLFVPYIHMSHKRIRNYGNNHIEIIPYHTITCQGFNRIRKWAYNKGISMPKPQNVLVASIFNCINMNYHEIHLYGTDHSWITEIRVNNKNEVCLTDSHFYDDKNVELKPWLSGSGKPFEMGEILHRLATTFESYHYLQEYAKQEDCHIINFTKNSFIDAFERR